MAWMQINVRNGYCQGDKSCRRAGGGGGLYEQQKEPTDHEMMRRWTGISAVLKPTADSPEALKRRQEKTA